MPRLKIGLCLQNLGVPFRRALTEARKLGATGVELDAVGDLAPRALSQTGRREFKHLLHSHDLELAALGCPLRHGLDVAENQQRRIEHVSEVLSLSFDLGARLAVAPLAPLPETETAQPLLREALAAIGRHGDRIGATLAFETGPASGAALQPFLASIDSGSLAACLSPGDLLAHGHDPEASARALAARVVYIRATDARHVGVGRGIRLVPLGHGDIDWLSMLATLEEIGYHGWLMVQTAGGADALAEAAAGIAFLRRLVGV